MAQLLDLDEEKVILNVLHELVAEAIGILSCNLLQRWLQPEDRLYAGMHTGEASLVAGNERTVDAHPFDWRGFVWWPDTSRSAISVIWAEPLVSDSNVVDVTWLHCLCRILISSGTGKFAATWAS